MSKHEKFILTPITTVIEEMKSASSNIGDGIESYPLCDYILQSTFTKMTGFQEQKMKCIDWELATNGYEYRRDFLKSISDKGEYSTFRAKNAVYNALIKEIVRYSGKGKIELITEIKNRCTINPIDIVKHIMDGTDIIYCKQRDYAAFLNSSQEFDNQFFNIPSNNNGGVVLLQNKLQRHYDDELYRQRNRIAHNTLSYQQNLPDLDGLKNESNYSRNYFFWFAILVLIDEIFMELYREYTKCLKSNSYFE